MEEKNNPVVSPPDSGEKDNPVVSPPDSGEKENAKEQKWNHTVFYSVIAVFLISLILSVLAIVNSLNNINATLKEISAKPGVEINTKALEDTLNDIKESSYSAIGELNAIRKSGTAQPEHNQLYLGIMGAGITDEADPTYKGVYVDSVEPGSGAEEAGITPGVIITAIDGEKVGSPQEISEILAKHTAGEEVNVTIEDIQNQDLKIVKNVRVALK